MRYLSFGVALMLTVCLTFLFGRVYKKRKEFIFIKLSEIDDLERRYTIASTKARKDIIVVNCGILLVADWILIIASVIQMILEVR